MKKLYKLGETLDVTIEKIVPNGFGLAFAENLTVFVPLSVAGDVVRVRIDLLKGKTAFAEIVEIIKPSADRIEPACEYFGSCGGCNFQQMPYEKQLEAKVGIIRDSLTRIGKINYKDEIPIIPSPKEFGYRARAQWHVDTRKKKIGYFQRNTHNVIDVEKCPILTPELQETLSDLQKNIAWESFWSEIVMIEASNSQDGISIFSDEIIEPTEEIYFQLNGNHYFYNAKTFFQGNPFLIEKLIETAIGNAQGKKALDLYCGVGLFTLSLAERFEKVIGVEAWERAVDFAEKTVENAKFSNVKFYREDVADFLSEDHNEMKDIDLILLDPPRSGTEKGTIEAIIKIQPKQISYVSCEPSTLARDLQTLTANNYLIETITALDMFPQTHHVETIVRLSKKTD
jgi:tRNA/tmRNA/rRNA uracil-C5-methylase (TrmA/RlmC/RlmD family)